MGAISDFRSTIHTPAAIGLAVVFIVLAGLGVWAALSAQQSVGDLRRSRQIADAFEEARYNVAAEESEERNYRLEPAPEVRTAIQTAAVAVAVSLERVGNFGDTNDQAFVASLIRTNAQYIASMGRMLAAVDEGDLELATTIDAQEIDPIFDAFQRQVDVAANEHRLAAARAQDDVSRIQSGVINATPFVALIALALLAVSWDVLRRRSMELLKAEKRVLAESERRLRGLVQNSADLVLLVDREGRITYQSPSLEKQYGYEPNGALGMTLVELIHPDDQERLVALFHESIEHPGVSTTIEVRANSASGDSVVLDATCCSLLDDPSLAGVVFNGHDITTRKQIEAQLLQSQKMEAIGTLAGGIAHDFNNLLTAITGYAGLAKRSLPDDHPGRPDIDQVISAAARAGALTRHLLAFARKEVRQPKVMSLNDVLCDTEKLLRPLIGEDIELVTRSAPGLGFVSIDEGQIGQVLVNLAVNARDAMPGGGVLTMATENVIMRGDRTGHPPELGPGDYVCLAVTDTGLGMTANTREHLFEPFFTTKEVGKGTGLGLATCYGIVQQAGGHIAVTSELGEGASFRVYLPRVEGDVPSVDFIEPRTRRLSGGETVIVVEDDAVLRTLRGRALEQEGYRVTGAATGPEALAQLVTLTRGVDLVVTDIVMPRMSGKQLAEQVQAAHPEIRILMISGFSEELVNDEGVLAEDVDFLAKPFTMDELAAKVREVLDSASSQRIPA